MAFKKCFFSTQIQKRERRRKKKMRKNNSARMILINECLGNRKILQEKIERERVGTGED